MFATNMSQDMAETVHFVKWSDPTHEHIDAPGLSDFPSYVMEAGEILSDGTVVPATIQIFGRPSTEIYNFPTGKSFAMKVRREGNGEFIAQ